MLPRLSLFPNETLLMDGTNVGGRRLVRLNELLLLGDLVTLCRSVGLSAPLRRSTTGNSGRYVYDTGCTFQQKMRILR
jgi:hypothetical protein